ncbi:MAG TPA: RICIN domain-containing protein, partial [Polyangiales bacterium]|nr:RICIN domain-containing protein [Polyangiales bacterium]
ANAPYTYAWAEAAVCSEFCTPADIPNQNDGYKACGGLNHVMTVWRNFDPNTSYKICNRVSGKCLDAPSTTDQSAVVQKSYAARTSQKWQIVQISPKKYKVVNKSSGKVLSVFQKNTADGTAIVQANYVSGAPDQLWSFTSMANATGFHAISPVSKSTSVVSLPSASSTGEDQAVQQWSWTSASHSQWSISLAN